MFKRLFMGLILAIVFVLVDYGIVQAFPLDPSEIATGQVFKYILVLGAEGWTLKRVLTGRWFADGHYESADDSKKDDDKD